jgi:hypothetical protein
MELCKKRIQLERPIAAIWQVKSYVAATAWQPRRQRVVRSRVLSFGAQNVPAA